MKKEQGYSIAELNLPIELFFTASKITYSWLEPAWSLLSPAITHVVDYPLAKLALSTLSPVSYIESRPVADTDWPTARGCPIVI